MDSLYGVCAMALSSYIHDLDVKKTPNKTPSVMIMPIYILFSLPRFNLLFTLLNPPFFIIYHLLNMICHLASGQPSLLPVIFQNEDEVPLMLQLNQHDLSHHLLSLRFQQVFLSCPYEHNGF